MNKKKVIYCVGQGELCKENSSPTGGKNEICEPNNSGKADNEYHSGKSLVSYLYYWKKYR